MHTRSLVGCVLVSLVALAVVEAALDAATVHVSVRLQWRAQHHGFPRASQRNTTALHSKPLNAESLNTISSVAPCDLPRLLEPPPEAIFIPPRV